MYEQHIVSKSVVSVFTFKRVYFLLKFPVNLIIFYFYRKFDKNASKKLSVSKMDKAHQLLY